MESGHYYTMRGVSGGLGKTKDGKPQLGIQLMVVDGDDCAGETITYYGYFSDNAKAYTFTNLRTLGWEGDDLSNLEGITKNEVRVLVAEEEYNGAYSLKVKGIYPLGGAGLANPMSEAEAKTFAKTMMGDVISHRTGGQPSAASSKPKPKAPPKNQSRRNGPDEYDSFGGASDDDIPF